MWGVSSERATPRGPVVVRGFSRGTRRQGGAFSSNEGLVGFFPTHPHGPRSRTGGGGSRQREPRTPGPLAGEGSGETSPGRGRVPPGPRVGSMPRVTDTLEPVQ